MIFDFLSFIVGKIVFFTGAIIGGSSFPKPLSKKEEEECIKLKMLGNKEARDKLITHNMRLVAHVVKKYSGSADNDDLISVGSIGLIKAVNTFEPQKGNSLATFAAKCIENEILMLLRANKKYKNDVYLSDSIGKDKDGNELSLIDLLSDEQGEVFDRVDRSIERDRLIEFLKANLTKREFSVIALRYGLKNGRIYAQREVASFLKISRSYISRIEKKALEKLKEGAKNKNFYC